MPSLTSLYPGTRVYSSRVFTRAAGETDTIAGSTGTVTLYDPTDTSIATPTVTVSVDGGGAFLTATYEYTLSTSAVAGVWHEKWAFSNVLVVVEEHTFRVLRGH